MEASAVEVRLRNHDARLESHHTAIGNLRDVSTRHETEIKVIGTELREAREDIADMKRQLEADAEERRKERGEQKIELAGTRKALYTAAAVMGGLMISVLGVLANLLANA